MNVKMEKATLNGLMLLKKCLIQLASAAFILLAFVVML